MKHTFRFLAHLTPSQQNPYVWTITDKEHHHLKSVLRLNPEDDVQVFDTQGHQAEAVVYAINKHETICHSKELSQAPAPSQPVIAMISALKAKDVSDYLPELIEIGVDCIHVYTPEGGQKVPNQEELLDRLHAVALAAFKQSKRVSFPQITYAADLKSALTALDQSAIGQKFYLDQYGQKPNALLSQSQSKGTCFVCGSEKGLSEKELMLLKDSGFLPLSLGRHVMRASTAAVCAGLFFCCLNA